VKAAGLHTEAGGTPQGKSNIFNSLQVYKFFFEIIVISLLHLKVV